MAVEQDAVLQSEPCRICEDPIAFVPIRDTDRVVCLNASPSEDGDWVVTEDGAVRVRTTNERARHFSDPKYRCHTEQHPELRRKRD